MVQLSPDTLAAGDNAPGYSCYHNTIEGFSFTHMSGVGWYGDFGNLQIMSTTGAMKLASGRADRKGEGWRSSFSHSTEQAKANYYAVSLDDYQIRAELTAAARSGILRFTFPQSEQSRIQIDLARRIGGTSTRRYVIVVSDHAIQGWMLCPATGGGWGNGGGHVTYTIYFHAEFCKLLVNFGIWKIAVPEDEFPVRHGLTTDYFSSDGYFRLVKEGQILLGCREQEGTHLGFFTEFATRSAEQVTEKAGISFVSMEGAAKNLAAKIPGWDFERVREQGTRFGRVP